MRCRAMSTAALSAIRRVGIIGAGQMGTGIASVASLYPFESVAMYDTDRTSVEKGFTRLSSYLTRSVSKNRITESEKNGALRRTEIASSIAQLVNNCDFVIEAATENLDIKLRIMRQLDQQAPTHCILASNTSSISITKLSGATSRMENVIGMHFFHPVTVMKLVEIVPAIGTSQSTVSITEALASALGKTTALSRDMPGFISNRLLMPYINEAVFALSEGIGTRHDIDTVMKLGTNVPMGPLELADFIGLDTCLAIMKVLHTQLGEDKYRPAPMLSQYVDAGWLGKKSGRGFYNYDKDAKL